MLLPFLPGRYDSVAVPLSMMVQLFGIVGLLLVPLGVVWLAYEFRSELKRRRRMFAIAALVSTSTVCVIVSLGAMFESGALGLGALGLPVPAVTGKCASGLSAWNRRHQGVSLRTHGAAYNVLFEQLSLRIGIKEIVMYNLRGEQAISSHALDVLQRR